LQRPLSRPTRLNACHTQALLRKLGGGLEDVIPGGGTHTRLKDILTGLRAAGDESAQMEALTNLCDLLSMSTEEALACVPALSRASLRVRSSR
jgi:hypothetical protein